MNRVELLAELRNTIGDTIRPYAWTDTRLILWLSEGQDKFCKKTGFWTDKITYTLTTVLDQQDYALDSRIISVRSAWIGDRQLIDGEGLSISDADFVDFDPQEPVHYRTDLATGYITFFEPVLADLTVALRVHRRSLEPFTTSRTDPELPEEFQLAMVEYAAYKAYGDNARETQDGQKASDHMANFRVYCKDGSQTYRRLTGDYVTVVPNTLYVV